MVVIILLGTGIKIVPQGYSYTVERFGRFTRLLSSRITPSGSLSFDRVGFRQNMMEQVLDIAPQNGDLSG